MDKVNMAEQFWADETMPAIGATEQPEIDKVANCMRMLEVKTPRPEKSEVAVRLVASAMHVDEIYAAQGTALGRFYGPKNVSEQNPVLFGSSVSGVVVAVGTEVADYKVGDEVVAIPSEHMEVASWAKYRCLGAKWVKKKAPQLSHTETAAATMAACVAYGAIGFAQVSPGDKCVVVGASGAIGVMVLQFLKSMGCHVTAVCSGKSEHMVREYGADEVVDYTKSDFGVVANKNGIEYKAVFDCVGGRDIEKSAFMCLTRDGVFETVVGPKQYIGQKKLSWFAFLKVMFHILGRVISTRLLPGPKYSFGERFPRFVIDEAMEKLIQYNIRMPINATVPFEIEAVRDAVIALQTHRSKGRIVIQFDVD